MNASHGAEQVLPIPSVITFEDWGIIDFQEAWRRQLDLVERRARGEIANTFVFCAHPSCVTLGRAFRRNPSALNLWCESFDIERGGLATYHHPAQWVVYPIVKFAKNESNPGFRSVHGLLRMLEDLGISVLRELGVDAGRSAGNTGVWVDGSRKIASIGLAVRQWVSFHGLALNIGPDVRGWQQIAPCGFESSVMTDLTSEFEKRGRPGSPSESPEELRQRLTVLAKEVLSISG